MKCDANCKYYPVCWCIGEGIRKIGEDCNRYELERPHGKWIPCSERLPEKYRTYIVTDETGAVFEYDYNDLTVHDKKWECCRREIVAWMPFPSAYKGRSEAE